MKKYKAFDGKTISYREWLPKDKPKGLIQIIHGMAEHSGCYDEIGNYLAKEGFAVYCHDQRGHGNTAIEDENYGFIAEQKGWQLLLEDAKRFNELIKKQFKLPVILYGHSMGSIVVQSYILQWGNEVSGLVLSGVPGQSALLLAIGRIIARREIKKQGIRHRSKLLSNLSFGSYNRKFKNTRTAYDWLSRDIEKVDEYIKDTRCGGTFSAGFYLDLFNGLKSLKRSDKLKNIEHNLPIFFLAGENDAAGNFGKSVWNRIDFYERHGFFDVEAVFYPECRHDLKLELNREMFFADIVTWLNSKFVKKDKHE